MTDSEKDGAHHDDVQRQKRASFAAQLERVRALTVDSFITMMGPSGASPHVVDIPGFAGFEFPRNDSSVPPEVPAQEPNEQSPNPATQFQEVRQDESMRSDSGAQVPELN